MNLLPFVLFIIGFVMIIKGSDWFVDAAIWVARVLKIPEIIIGATLVSLCTTLPEAMVSANSALRGNTDMALGNALGSIACNTGLILAITIIFSRPSLVDRKRFQKKGLLLITLILFVLATSLINGAITRITGLILLTILVLYLFNNIRESKKSISNVELAKKQSVDISTKIIVKNLVLFTVGLIFTIIGANLLVTNGEIIATLLGVPDIIIGLTMTAFGTSLPELMTAIAAIRKKAYNLTVGNVLGANILNIILVIGLSSSILPIPTDLNILQFHLPFTLLIVGSAVIFGFINKDCLKRRNGFMLLCTYALYIFLMIKII